MMMQCGCGSTVDHSTRTHQGTLHEGSSVLQCKLPCCRAFSDALASDKRPRRPRTHSPAHLKIIVCPSDVAKRMALPCDAPEVLSMVPAPHDSPLNGIERVGRDASPEARRPQAHEALARLFFCRLVREKVSPAGTDEGPVTGPTPGAQGMPLIGM